MGKWPCSAFRCEKAQRDDFVRLTHAAATCQTHALNIFPNSLDFRSTE